MCYFAEEGVGPPPEDVTFIERADGPPWFDVEARGNTLERQHSLAEADEYLTRYPLGRDHDTAAVAERASRLRSW